MPTQPVSPFRDALLRAVAVVTVLVLLVVAYRLLPLLLLVFLAAVVAAGMSRPARLLAHAGLPRTAAVALAYLALLLVLAGALGVVVPPLVTQTNQLFADLPDLLTRARATLDGLIGKQAVETLLGNVPTPQAGPILNVPITLASALVNLAIVVLLSLFLILERDEVWSWVAELVAPEDRRPLRRISMQALDKLGAYIRGQLLVMTITGVVSTIGMLVIGVPFALPLGLLAFLSEAIPMAGPFISGIPIVALGFIEDPVKGFLILGWIVALQQLEGWVLIPMIQGRVLKLSPAVVMVAVIAGGILGGILGAIVALPLVAVLDVVMREVVIPVRRRQYQEDEASS